jgi:hypothetical protein
MCVVSLACSLCVFEYVLCVRVSVWGVCVCVCDVLFPLPAVFRQSNGGLHAGTGRSGHHLAAVHRRMHPVRLRLLWDNPRCAPRSHASGFHPHALISPPACRSMCPHVAPCAYMPRRYVAACAHTWAACPHMCDRHVVTWLSACARGMCSPLLLPAS